MIDRRTLITSMAAGAAFASTPSFGKPSPVQSLNAIALAKGRRFGSCISAGGIGAGSIADPDYAGLVGRECGVIVAENEMKWQALHPAQDKFNFAPCDAIASWAKARNITLRGHNLVWHRARWLPEWINNFDYGARPATKAESLVTEHINAVIGRYGKQVSSWDVVNEAVNDAANGLEETSISRAMGSVEATLDLAFHTARAAVPAATLVYNDYMSWEPSYAGHRNQVLKLLEGFKKRVVPVDALGIQSHLEIFSLDPATGTGPYAEKEWRSFLDSVTAMGYRLLVTEFDVRDKGIPTDIAMRDTKVADYVRRYFDVMLSYPQLGDILTWGMVDAYSWLQEFAPRDDGHEVRGTPYDSNFKPKAMRSALAASLQQAVKAA